MAASRRILVVDDDRAMVRTLADVLELQGWEAETAHSGEEAVELAERHGFALILMDIKMGRMNGVEALRRIRELRPGARVILMTAYSASELVDEAVEQGALQVLSKPVALQELLRLVEDQARTPPAHPVLVVDDDPLFLRSLCDGLEKEGLVTRAAGGLKEALSLLEEERIQVVLLDLNLNGFAGREAVAAVRELCPEVLLILFSGYPTALRELERELPSGWVAGTVTKPFDPAELIGLIRDLDV